MDNILTNENYFSSEMSMKYMGYSQFKEFKKCEAEALAKCKHEITEEYTDALLIGSYVDAYFSNEMDIFVKEHPEAFNSKTGELKANLKIADTVIKSIEEDELLLKYLSGEHQKIFTGEIAGVPFKIKVDSYFEGKIIVDQKVMRDMKPVWVERDGKNVKVNFVDAWEYQLEGAIYQEIVRQNTGMKLPFVLAVTTKEKVPAKALLEIDQEELDKALEEVKRLAPHFYDVKRGLVEPTECGDCDYCRSKKKVTGIKSYHDFDPYKEGESLKELF